jgi:hypothetical protein
MILSGNPADLMFFEKQVQGLEVCTVLPVLAARTSAEQMVPAPGNN